LIWDQSSRRFKIYLRTW